MFYSLPKKIQLEPSQAKWAIDANQSVLLIAGLDDLKTVSNWQDSETNKHLKQLVKKAKALEIPVIDLTVAQTSQAMMLLGEHLSYKKQLYVTGQITQQIKQLLDYIQSATDEICIIEDAIYLQNIDQHLHWIEVISKQKIHHTNTYNLLRLWSLSAPKEQILSAKGILLAVAEQIELEPLEIDPTVNLRNYGLDSVSIVSLIGLWRANGANISYEDFENGLSLADILKKIVL
jgi:aryl carrier-like protein